MAQHPLRPRRGPREPALLSGMLRWHSSAVKRQPDGRISADDGASRRCAGTTASRRAPNRSDQGGGAGLGWGGARAGQPGSNRVPTQGNEQGRTAMRPHPCCSPSQKHTWSCVSLRRSRPRFAISRSQGSTPAWAKGVRCGGPRIKSVICYHGTTTPTRIRRTQAISGYS
jgi:hypothetical protein